MEAQESRLSDAGFTRLEMVVGLVVVALLIGISVPAFTRITECGCQPKNLSNAKQIYLGLKLYAGDHDEHFPDASTNSNEAYQELYPGYINNKEVFYFHHSAWTPNAPTKASLASKVLETGENHFAYVSHLNSQSNPEFPLVAEGFVEGKPGTYTSSSKAKGGASKGRLGFVAVVVRVDGSGTFEKVRHSDFRVYAITGNGRETRDLFASAPGWLAPDQVPLNPASK